jgi:hypothetical protein
MKNDNFLIHLAVAAAISFGVSIYAWAGLGVFAPVPFLAVSSGVSIAAALGGFLAGRRLALTAAIALILRIAILAAAVGV